MPFGVAQNNSTNHKFNDKLYELFDGRKIKILDLGCAGGGFIKDCLTDGHFAVGVEGSDYAKNNQLGCWPKIPDNLFTADITKPFNIQTLMYLNEMVAGYTNVYFDIITMWDVLEHILPVDLESLMFNLLCHSAYQSYVICSINVASKAHAELIKDDWGPGKHHQNIQPPEYWDEWFGRYGFKNDIEKLSYFEKEFVRGPCYGCDNNATEERYYQKDLPVELQWATINRVYQRI
jgi:hypothetical protein